MNARQREAFHQYLGLGDGRSLHRLSREPDAPSISTLKRWSTRHSWASLIREQDARATEELVRRNAETQIAQTANDLRAVSRLKGQFYRRMKLDPADLTLSLKGKQRPVDIGLREYLWLLEAEQDLYGFMHRLTKLGHPEGP